MAGSHYNMKNYVKGSQHQEAWEPTVVMCPGPAWKLSVMVDIHRVVLAEFMKVVPLQVECKWRFRTQELVR